MRQLLTDSQADLDENMEAEGEIITKIVCCKQLVQRPNTKLKIVMKWLL